MDIASYRRSGALLQISGKLVWPLEVEFDLHTRALLDEAARRGLKEIAIDVTGLEAMGSQYIGALAAVAAEMKKLGGTLTVRATGRVADLLRQCGLDRVMSLEIE